MRTSWLTAITLASAAVLSIPQIAGAQTFTPPMPPAGTSIVGPGAIHPLLNVENSGGNDVVAIQENTAPVAYGGGTLNIINGCIGPNNGFADVGSGTYATTTKNHLYSFKFAAAISNFSLRMADWGDLLPYGGNPDHTYAFTMTAYNAADQVVDTDTIQFTSSSTATSNRPSNEFGNLAIAGDSCRSTPGQPGNYTFQVHGSGIVRVTLAPRDRQSLDPNIAFANLTFTVEARHVQIDVKPGSVVNPVNLKSNGKLPVAILSSEDFDATTVVPSSIRLADARVATKPNGTLLYSFEDVNNDGRLDLLFHVNTQDISSDSTVLHLTTETSGGGFIVGEDTVVFIH